jgi:two-component system, OmpR family, alkaline phosphatase synthesis response regulator PhoP
MDLMDTAQNHILYIEDHQDTVDLVKLILGHANYWVTTASRSEEALKLAREQHFDLYILDSWLPDCTGIELCKQLREFDHVTPIMFLSAAAYDADKQAALDSGAQSYLVKPVDIRVLKSEVDGLILAVTNKYGPAEGLGLTDSPLRGVKDDRETELDLRNLRTILT